MALSIHRLSQEKKAMEWRADRRLYVTNDRSRLCEETDPDVGFLLATPDALVSDEDCERYKLGPYADEPEKKSKRKSKEAPKSAEVLDGDAEGGVPSDAENADTTAMTTTDVPPSSGTGSATSDTTPQAGASAQRTRQPK